MAEGLGTGVSLVMLINNTQTMSDACPWVPLHRKPRGQLHSVWGRVVLMAVHDLEDKKERAAPGEVMKQWAGQAGGDV